MINAKECRLDNWVQDKEGKLFAQVCDISDDLVECEWNNGGYYLEPFPISLTEEVLRKCGFHFEDMADLGMNIYLVIFPRELYLSFNEGSIWIGEYDTKIKYLHQLQNLYFAFHAKELEIDLL